MSTLTLPSSLECEQSTTKMVVADKEEKKNEEIDELEALDALDKEASEYKKVSKLFPPGSECPSNSPPTRMPKSTVSLKPSSSMRTFCL